MDGIEMYASYIFILFSGCYDHAAIGDALNLLSLPDMDSKYMQLIVN
jgi:hypothetical protein